MGLVIFPDVTMVESFGMGVGFVVVNSTEPNGLYMDNAC